MNDSSLLMNDSSLLMNDSSLLMNDLSVELWREYDIPGRAEPYRIDNPATLYFREGGSTHRVVDSAGVAHCVPRWQSRDNEKPVDF